MSITESRNSHYDFMTLLWAFIFFLCVMQEIHEIGPAVHPVFFMQYPSFFIASAFPAHPIMRIAAPNRSQVTSGFMCHSERGGGSVGLVLVWGVAKRTHSMDVRPRRVPMGRVLRRTPRKRRSMAFVVRTCLRPSGVGCRKRAGRSSMSSRRHSIDKQSATAHMPPHTAWRPAHDRHSRPVPRSPSVRQRITGKNTGLGKISILKWGESGSPTNCEMKYTPNLQNL